jgi:hypothetical protein
MNNYVIIAINFIAGSHVPRRRDLSTNSEQVRGTSELNLHEKRINITSVILKNIEILRY